MGLGKSHYLLLLLLQTLSFHSSFAVPPPSYVAFYRNQVGSYTIAVALAFKYDQCAALLDVFKELGVEDQILQDLSSATHGVISRFISSSLINVGGGDLWTTQFNHFGVTSNHVVNSAYALVSTAAYAVADAYGITNVLAYSPTMKERREIARSTKSYTSDFEPEDFMIWGRNPNSTLSYAEAMDTLKYAFRMDATLAENEVIVGAASSTNSLRNELYCANYNGASFKCIDWNHSFYSGARTCSYTCRTGQACLSTQPLVVDKR